MMKRSWQILLLFASLVMALHAEITLSDMQVFSGKPWREVAIGYTVVGTSSAPRRLQVRARDNLTGTTYDCTTLTDASLAPGRHVMKWNAQADGVKICSSNVEITVQVVAAVPMYCVIDLSGGASASSYPVTELVEPPSGGFNVDEYKTSKLVLRRVEAGTFTMGERSTDYPNASDKGLHQVTLTKPFYVGVFEVTQRQWELVTGNRPSNFKNTSCYATRPVEKVSYNMIRGSTAGTGWPGSSAVDADSFLGRLRARAGVDFDLPTEAQWEYACRAGTTTALNSGVNLTNAVIDASMTVVGRYKGNGVLSTPDSIDTSGGTAAVGSYAPNAWGLYGMHGGVWELCLDWHNNGVLSSLAETDPKGVSSGTARVRRGGSWCDNARDCRSGNRSFVGPSSVQDSIGFRLVRTLSNE